MIKQRFAKKNVNLQSTETIAAEDTVRFSNSAVADNDP